MYISFYIKQWPMRYEQVKQDSCADPGFFVRRRGGGGRGPTARKQSGQCFFSHQLISTYFTVYRVDPMFLLQRGGGGPTSSRGWGVSKETHITCDFPGGGEVQTP